MLRLAFRSLLAIEPTVHIAITILEPSHFFALPFIMTTPRLPAVHKHHRLLIVGSNFHLEHIRKLAVNVLVAATRGAESRHRAHLVLQRVVEGHVEDVLGVVGLIFLVLLYVHAAPATLVALSER